MLIALRLPNIIFLFEFLRSMVFTTASVPLIGDRNHRRMEVTALLGAIFAPPVFNSLYDPFGSPCRGQKPQREGPYPIPKP